MRAFAPWIAALWLLAGLPVAAQTRYHSYPGAIHIHTRYSDGSGTFPEVVDAAREDGLRYLIFTDHNTLQPIRDGHQRYWDETLVLVGTEISTDSGHCLALDGPGDFRWNTRDAQRVIDRVNAAGGFTILAHPLSPRWRWRDWTVRGYTGMEILNLASIVDDDLRAASHRVRLGDRSVRRLLELAQRYVVNPDATLARLTNRTVDPERHQWDRLTQPDRRVVAIGSVDAHARIEVRRRELRVPTYGEAFESIQTYVVLLQPLRGSSTSTGGWFTGRCGTVAATASIPGWRRHRSSASSPGRETGRRPWDSRCAWSSRSGSG